MRTFNVTVNGTSYQVEVEETAGGAPAAAPAAPAPAPAAPSAPQPVKTPAPAPKPAAPLAGGQSIKSPMPGTILDIRVKAGDSVKKGAVLCILEAMKMENEIIASSDGSVAQVVVSKGASVNAGDILLVMN
ncbi:MAG: biotin/lipoyl-containing protein [Christensenellales bacterium]